MAQKVAAPKRRPRVGGIKAIVGEFIAEPRLGVTEDLVWEDSECGFPDLSRAGCVDSTFPLTYDEIEYDDDGDIYTLNREGNTVTVSVVFTATVNTPEGFYPAWAPAANTVHAVPGGGNVNVTTFGIIYSDGTPTGTFTFTYAANPLNKVGGYYPPFVGEGPEIHELIGPPFAQYKAIGCFLGGDKDEDGTYSDQARRALEAGEDRELELRLWQWAAAAPSSGTSSSFVGAIAAAEEYADIAYLYQPVLIMSRGSAQAAFEKGALKSDDGLLYTANGTPVLSTGAIPDGAEDTVAIIGTPAVYASGVVTGAGIHHALNRELAVAQRLYALGVDCDFRYAVSVTAP